VVFLEIIHQGSLLVSEIFIDLSSNRVDVILEVVLVKLLLGSLSALKSLL
jgi:hypothetical protein